MSPSHLLRRLVHILDRNSVPALLAKLLRRPREPELEVPASAVNPPLVHPFDAAYHVDTSGFQPGHSLAPGLFHTDYYGISPSTLSQALDHLGLTRIDWTRFTFVDLGCGKGRAMFVAARHPFQRILGGELSAILCEIARANTQTFHAPWQQCRSFEVVHADATTFTFPETPLVVFLYHPFLAPTLRRVLRNLERSVRQHPREVFLLYANPTYEKVMAKFPFLEMQWHYRLALSPEDAHACLLQIANEHYALYRHL